MPPGLDARSLILIASSEGVSAKRGLVGAFFCAFFRLPGGDGRGLGGGTDGAGVDEKESREGPAWAVRAVSDLSETSTAVLASLASPAEAILGLFELSFRLRDFFGHSPHGPRSPALPRAELPASSSKDYSVDMAATRAARVTRLLSQARSSFAGCQCHGCSSGVGHHHSPHDVLSASKAIASGGRHRVRAYATPVDGPIPQIHGNTDYAFEVAAANLRFGAGVTREVGMDFANMRARKVGVFTDPTVARLHPMKAALESLEEAGVPYEVFSDCKVEPTQERCALWFAPMVID